MLKAESAISAKFEADRIKELEIMESDFVKIETETANVMFFDGISDEMIEGNILDFADDDESDEGTPTRKKK